MTDALPVLKEADALRADIYRLFATLLRQAPDTDLLNWLAGLAIDQDGSRLAECWQALAEAAKGTEERDAEESSSEIKQLQRAHFRHLIGVIQGEIVPYASWYRNGELMEAALVALRRDLKVLGFERSEHTRDPEDHLAALCEVMAMLVESESAEQAYFFSQHIAPWAASCFADLGQVDTALYAALGQLGGAFMESEKASLNVEAQDNTGQQRVTPFDSSNLITKAKGLV